MLRVFYCFNEPHLRFKTGGGHSAAEMPCDKSNKKRFFEQIIVDFTN